MIDKWLCRLIVLVFMSYMTVIGAYVVVGIVTLLYNYSNLYSMLILIPMGGYLVRYALGWWAKRSLESWLKG